MKEGSSWRKFYEQACLPAPTIDFSRWQVLALSRMEASSETIDKLKSYFEEKEEISMAFLFGSAAAGREIPESDIDVAVWFKNKWTVGDADKIQGEIIDIIHRNVDLIVLNQARPTIAWAAMRGKKLIIRDYRLYFSKLIETSMEAEDMQDFILDLFRLRQKIRREANK